MTVDHQQRVDAEVGGVDESIATASELASSPTGVAAVAGPWSADVGCSSGGLSREMGPVAEQLAAPLLSLFL